MQTVLLQTKGSSATTVLETGTLNVTFMTAHKHPTLGWQGSSQCPLYFSNWMLLIIPSGVWLDSTPSRGSTRKVMKCQILYGQLLFQPALPGFNSWTGYPSSGGSRGGVDGGGGLQLWMAPLRVDYYQTSMSAKIKSNNNNTQICKLQHRERERERERGGGGRIIRETEAYNSQQR